MIRRTLALAGAAVLIVGFTSVTSPAAADPIPAQPGDILLNEIGIDLVNAGTTGNVQGDFIELVNVTGTELTVAGWQVKGCNDTSSFNITATFPVGTDIPANGSLLIASDDFSGPDPRDLPFVSTAALEQSDGGAELLDDSATSTHSVMWENPHPNCSLFVEVAEGPLDSSNSINRASPEWTLGAPTPDGLTL